MYWQVYLHKTSVSAEQLLIKILNRAKELMMGGMELFASPQLKLFLSNNISKEDFKNDEKIMENYALFDDSDIMSAMKVWSNCSDKVLSFLCHNMLWRRLFKVEVRQEMVQESELDDYLKRYSEKLGITKEEAKYLLVVHPVSAYTYKSKSDSIKVLYSAQELKDITEASDLLDISLMSKHEQKYYYYIHL